MGTLSDSSPDPQDQQIRGCHHQKAQILRCANAPRGHRRRQDAAGRTNIAGTGDTLHEGRRARRRWWRLPVGEAPVGGITPVPNAAYHLRGASTGTAIFDQSRGNKVVGKTLSPSKALFPRSVASVHIPTQYDDDDF
ncbi:hypothetical protein B7494_g7968 [Chlorociboria aeruginascens]|nr:hypothetical protein B7494_g7968 [Chlorociboria aeruginascens]